MKSIKKNLGILAVILLIFIGIKIKIKAVEIDDFFWEVTWQGIKYSGEYVGDLEAGEPEGEGSFIGESTNGDRIEYSGNWVDGFMHGRGELLESSKKITYVGTFCENKLNGRITITQEENSEIEKVSYFYDVPYGIYIKKNANKKIVQKDRFCYGYKISELLKQSEKTISYGELLYESEKFLMQFVKLNCEVIEKSYYEQDGKIYVKVLVKDKDEQKYILKYGVNGSNRPETYMPAIGIDSGDRMEVYGFFKGIEGYMGHNGNFGNYPLISAWGKNWDQYQDIDMNCLELSYKRFLEYPYEYRNTKIKFRGKVKKVDTIKSSNAVEIIVSSDEFSDGEEYFICTINKTELLENSIQLLEGDLLELEGKLSLYKILQVAENEYVTYPLVQVQNVTIE